MKRDEEERAAALRIVRALCDEEIRRHAAEKKTFWFVYTLPRSIGPAYPRYKAVEIAPLLAVQLGSSLDGFRARQLDEKTIYISWHGSSTSEKESTVTPSVAGSAARRTVDLANVSTAEALSVLDHLKRMATQVEINERFAPPRR